MRQQPEGRGLWKEHRVQCKGSAVIHFTIHTLPARLRNPKNWRPHRPSGLDRETLKRYRERRKGCETYLKTGHLTKAAKAAGCTPSELRRLFHRCLTCTDDGGIVGWI